MLLQLGLGFDCFCFAGAGAAWGNESGEAIASNAKKKQNVRSERISAASDRVQIVLLPQVGTMQSSARSVLSGESVPLFCLRVNYSVTIHGESEEQWQT